jgi:hypothetical protein
MNSLLAITSAMLLRGADNDVVTSAGALAPEAQMNIDAPPLFRQHGTPMYRYRAWRLSPSADNKVLPISCECTGVPVNMGLKRTGGDRLQLERDPLGSCLRPTAFYGIRRLRSPRH